MDEQLSLRERKKIETRNRILYTAIELFQHQGFEETTIEEIAAQANISRGTFFNYFASKESLLHEIALQELADLHDLIEQTPGRAVTKIRQLIHRLVADTLPYLRVTRYVLLGAMLAPTDQTAFNLRLGPLLEDLVRTAQAEQDIRNDVQAKEVVHVLVGVYLSVLVEQLATPTQDHAQAQSTIERMVEMILDGIGDKKDKK